MVVSNSLPTFKKASATRGKTGMDLLLFGPPGIGKTTLVATAQDSEFGRDLLWFDVDGSSVTLEDRDDIAVWPDRSETPNPTWQELRSVVDQLVAAGGDSPYKTIAMDSISAIYYDLIMPKVVGSKDAQPKIQHWGEANRLLLKLISDLRTLNAQGINTIFIGHQKEEKEIIDAETGASVIHLRLASSPQGRDEILRMINNVGYYGWDRRMQNRVLKFRAERKVDAPKFRQPRTGEQMPLELTNPTMHEVLKYVRKVD
jgi:hypothetical protein